MATIGQINNRNQRLIAFFKAAILYLCTIPLLIFIIRNNVQNPIPDGNEDTGNESTFQQLKVDNDALEKMIFYIDSVATLTKELVTLDKQEFENRGSKKGEIDKTELKIKRLYEKIQDIKISKKLEDNREKIDKIYAILAENEGKIDELRSNNVEAEDDNEELLEQISDNNETAAAETEEAHEEEVAGLEEQIENKDDEIEDLNGQIASVNNELASEREKITTMSAKNQQTLLMIGEIKTTLDTEERDLGIFRERCKRLVDAVKPKVYQLETFVRD